MSTSADKLVSQIKDLPDLEKLRLVEAILTELDKPDPDIDPRLGGRSEEALGRLQSRAHFHRLVRGSDGQVPVMMEIRFVSLANREVEDAVQWYEARDQDLVASSSMNWIASFDSSGFIPTRARRLRRK